MSGSRGSTRTRTDRRDRTPPAPERAPRAEPGRITDEGVAALRARVSIAEPHPAPAHYLRPNEDAFRIVSRAHGADNPLYCDPDYAANTRWSGPIAPPALIGGDTLVGEDEVTSLDGDIAARFDRS